MVLQEIVSGTFKFQAFEDNFPDGDDSDKHELFADNTIDCLGGKFGFKFARKNGKLAAHFLRRDTGVFPLKIKCVLSVPGSREHTFEVTFLPEWCKSAWRVDPKSLVSKGVFGWPDYPVPAATLRQAAAGDGGVLHLQAEITGSRSSSAMLASHESCLRDNLQELVAAIIGSPTIRLLGPDGAQLELPKALLCAHSPVMRAALEGQMEEGQLQMINVDDMKLQALQDFAVCLCSGGLPAVMVTDWERLLDLLVIADKYGVHALVKACISLLSVSVSEKTAAPLLKIADQAGFTQLLRCAMYYCLACRTRMLAVIDSDEYTHFSADLLRNIVAHQDLVETGRIPKYPLCFQYLEVEREFDDNTDWSTLSTTKLRRACFERDLSASGAPAELVSRLSATGWLHTETEPELNREL